MRKDSYKYYYIYITTNLKNGKRYIGLHKTDNLDDNYIGSGRIFLKAVKKYGTKGFSREIIEFCTSEEEMIIREIYWIKYLNAKNNKNFYNFTDGGESKSGFVMPKYYKKKVSKGLREYFKNNPEAIKRMSDKKKGIPLSKESIQKRQVTKLKRKSDCVSYLVFNKDKSIERYECQREMLDIYGQCIAVNIRRKGYLVTKDKLFLKERVFLERFKGNEQDVLNILNNYKKFQRKKKNDVYLQELEKQVL